MSKTTVIRDRLASLAIIGLLVSAGCSDGEGPPGPAVGSEGGPCYGNGTCNGTLRCSANVCVAVTLPDASPPDVGTAQEDSGIAQPDAGTAEDAGGEADASSPPGSDAAADAGSPDANDEDSGSLDSSAGDSGATADAAASDAGALDASPDGGTTDASTPDSGAPSDAGVAGDAGLGRDAGGACGSTRECLPSEVCGDLQLVNNNTLVQATCALPNAGGAAVGAACSSDGQCYSKLCLDTISGECSEACVDAQLDCPPGFACVGYVWQPGAATITVCNRGCARDADCAGGNPGNVCTTQTFQSQGAWQLGQVCNVPLGTKVLGEPCASGAECRTGICLTSSRYVGCTGPGGCAADETCQCAGGGAPPCAGGAAAACVSKACDALCTSAADCQSTYGGNPLTACDSPVTFVLPDQTQVDVLTCTRPN